MQELYEYYKAGGYVRAKPYHHALLDSGAANAEVIIRSAICGGQIALDSVVPAVPPPEALGDIASPRRRREGALQSMAHLSSISTTP